MKCMHFLSLHFPGPPRSSWISLSCACGYNRDPGSTKTHVHKFAYHGTAYDSTVGWSSTWHPGVVCLFVPHRCMGHQSTALGDFVPGVCGFDLSSRPSPIRPNTKNSYSRPGMLIALTEPTRPNTTQRMIPC